ncbi:MAG: hypothetical protein WCP89_04220, partial [archaeon]
MEEYNKPLEQRLGMENITIEDPNTGRTYSGNDINAYLAGKVEKIIWVNNMGQFGDFYEARTSALNAIGYVKNRITQQRDNAKIEILDKLELFHAEVKHFSVYEDIFKRQISPETRDHVEEALTFSIWKLDPLIIPSKEDTIQLLIWGGREVLAAAYERPKQEFERVKRGYIHNIKELVRKIKEETPKNETIKFMKEVQDYLLSTQEKEQEGDIDKFAIGLAKRLD